jgi:hypothetical protein
VANGGTEASPERRGNVGSGREPGRLPTLGIYGDVNVGRTRGETARPTLTRAQTSTPQAGLGAQGSAALTAYIAVNAARVRDPAGRAAFTRAARAATGSPHSLDAPFESRPGRAWG